MKSNGYKKRKGKKRMTIQANLTNLSFKPENVRKSDHLSVKIQLVIIYSEHILAQIKQMYHLRELANR